MANFLDILTNVWISAHFTEILTALLTVGATFWLHRKRQLLQALSALKSEVKENKERTEFIIPHIKREIEAVKEEKQQLDRTDSFLIDGYNYVRRQGILPQLSDELQEKIREHYSQLEAANNQIKNREQLKTGGGAALTNYIELVTVLDQMALFYILNLNPSLMTEFDIDESYMQEIKPSVSDKDWTIMTGQREPDIKAGFDDLEEKLEQKINDHFLLSRIV